MIVAAYEEKVNALIRENGDLRLLRHSSHCEALRFQMRLFVCVHRKSWKELHNELHQLLSSYGSVLANPNVSDAAIFFVENTRTHTSQ